MQQRNVHGQPLPQRDGARVCAAAQTPRAYEPRRDDERVCAAARGPRAYEPLALQGARVGASAPTPSAHEPLALRGVRVGATGPMREPRIISLFLLALAVAACGRDADAHDRLQAPPDAGNPRSMRDADAPDSSAANGGRSGTQAGGGGTRSTRPRADVGQDSMPPGRGSADAADSDRDAGPPAADGGSDNAGEILTNRYDNARTGANLDEHTLSPATVPMLGLRGRWLVDGEIYAQVLVAADVDVLGQKRAVAIVATMNNSVYAFDADAAPEDAFLWQRGGMGELGTPGFCARNIGGSNGILATPVIDKARQRLYVVARDCDPSFAPTMPRCQQRLVQLDLRTGEVLHSLNVTGHVAVAADGGMPSDLTFEPSKQWNRPGLLLAGDDLVIAFGAGPAGDQHEEDFVYHGWVFRYDVRDLERAPDVYCTTPRGRGGSVWQSGAGPAADDTGIYITGANGIMADGKVHDPGEWPTTPNGQEDSVIRLPRSAPFPTPQDRVTQFWDARAYIAAGNVFQHMESGDNGFGSSGPMLIPDTTLLLVGTKAGLVYLLDRAQLTAAQEPLSPFTDLPLQPGHSLYLHSWWGIPMTTQAFVFWRPDTAQDSNRFGYAFAWPSNDRLRALRLDHQSSTLELVATSEVPDSNGGGNLVLSASGHAADSGVLWAASRDPSDTSGFSGQLRALDPLTLKVLWQTDTPAWSKFTPPTVVRGRVYLPSTSPATTSTQQVLVYGLQ